MNGQQSRSTLVMEAYARRQSGNDMHRLLAIPVDRWWSSSTRHTVFSGWLLSGRKFGADHDEMKHTSLSLELEATCDERLCEKLASDLKRCFSTPPQQL